MRPFRIEEVLRTSDPIPEYAQHSRRLRTRLMKSISRESARGLVVTDASRSKGCRNSSGVTLLRWANCCMVWFQSRVIDADVALTLTLCN